MIVLTLALLHACATAPIDRRADDANNETETYDAVSSATPGQSASDANAAATDWIVLTLLALAALLHRQRAATASNYPKSKRPAACRPAGTNNDA